MADFRERRQSGVRDRRDISHGGRRAEDRLTTAPRPSIVCVACTTGIAVIDTVSYQLGQRTTTYRCTKCGHFQNLIAIP
jgi:hypothetical protein